MERITIIIETSNAAFGDYPELEVKHILRRLIKESDLRESQNLRDSNGNKVGTVSIYP